MEHGIKRLNRELIRRGAILNIYKDTMRLPNGEIEEWDYIEHRMGAAAVVAVPEPGKVLMVHQYRPALERMTLEIPAGSRDSVTEEQLIEVQEPAETIEPSGSPEIGFMGETAEEGQNNNEKILEMHRQGKSTVAIAKELGLGVGEVKLVIDLYKA